MVRLGIICICLLFAIVKNYGQISEPGLPESFLIRTKSAKILPVTKLDSLDYNLLQKSDTEKGIKNRYSIVKQLNIDIKKEGVKTIIANKGIIWQYNIKSSNSLALGINFGLYLIPPEAKLFIYDETHTQILGSFTDKNNSEVALLTIADLNSNNAVIEYFEPFEPQFEGELIISSITQAYRKISYSTQAQTVARIGINCEQGNNWQDEKHAICRMTYNDGQNGYYCTGFLVNNTAADGTPYFMTANHCISSNKVALTLVTYFNYENSTCYTTDALANQTLSGATLKANNIYSDFSLLQLRDLPPVSYQPYYAGWDATKNIATSSTGIHHPAGSPKCISLDYGAPVNFGGKISWDDGYLSSAYTHWKVIFDEGQTEGGSSGSPLFDDKKRVIGQLHGGGETDEFYGKFNVSWNNSAVTNAQLKTWLDPLNSGTLILNGTYYKVKPKSQFISNLQQICINDAVTFTDKSYYSPDEWKWTISPNGFEFIGGTDSLSQNPQVKFNKTGLYNISLITKNIYGSDTLIKTNLITTVSSIQASFLDIPIDSTICGCNLKSYKLNVTGATKYTYSLDRNDKITPSIVSNNFYLTLKDEAYGSGNFNTWVKVLGTTGSCTSTDSALLKINMPVNDNIKNAIQILPGINTGFTNKCASVEDYEPSPAAGNCITGNTWCNKTLNGSLWFTFRGPSDGKINIRATGYNNRIAVYDADADSLIMEGRYTIVGANDNISTTDNTALIKDIVVEKGKTYWLQVDADKPVIGNCTIEMWSSTVEIFPNITPGPLEVIISTENSGTAKLKIFSNTGQLRYENDYAISNESNRLQLDVTELKTGIYYVHVVINGNILKSKFVKTN